MSGHILAMWDDSAGRCVSVHPAHAVCIHLSGHPTQCYLRDIHDEDCLPDGEPVAVWWFERLGDAVGYGGLWQQSTNEASLSPFPANATLLFERKEPPRDVLAQNK